MGSFLASSEIRKMFVTPMSEMHAEIMRLCDEWDTAVENEEIAVENLHLNEVTAQKSIGAIRKFVRELKGKLDDARLGVYRYRLAEWQNRQNTRQENASALSRLNDAENVAPLTAENFSGEPVSGAFAQRLLEEDKKPLPKQGKDLRKDSTPKAQRQKQKDQP